MRRLDIGALGRKAVLTCCGALSAGLLLAALGAAPASAAGGIYFGGRVGVNLTHDGDVGGGGGDDEVSFYPGGGGGLYVGYAFDWGLRIEGESLSRLNYSDRRVAATGESYYLYSTAYMANLFYEFRNATGFWPYLGGGGGFATYTFLSDSGQSDSGIVPAGQLGAGVSYKLSRRVLLSLDYRFLITTNPDVSVDNNSFDFQHRNSSVLFGVRVQF